MFEEITYQKILDEIAKSPVKQLSKVYNFVHQINNQTNNEKNYVNEIISFAGA